MRIKLSRMSVVCTHLARPIFTTTLPVLLLLYAKLPRITIPVTSTTSDTDSATLMVRVIRNKRSQNSTWSLRPARSSSRMSQIEIPAGNQNMQMRFLQPGQIERARLKYWRQYGCWAVGCSTCPWWWCCEEGAQSPSWAGQQRRQEVPLVRIQTVQVSPVPQRTDSGGLTVHVGELVYVLSDSFCTWLLQPMGRRDQSR